MLSPSDAPYTAAARPAGPLPTTTRSNTKPGAGWNVSPRCSANSPGVGRRRIAVGVTTTGVCTGRRPMLASSTPTSSASSRSIQLYTRCDRAAKRTQGGGLGGEPGADDADGIRAGAGPEGFAAGHERAEDDVGDIRFRTHQPAELGEGDHQHAPGTRDPGGEVGPLAGEEVQLAQEPSLAVDGDEDVAVAVGADDLDFALEDHDEVDRLVAGLEEQVADRDRPFRAVRRQVGERGRVERGRDRILSTGPGHAPGRSSADSEGGADVGKWSVLSDACGSVTPPKVAACRAAPPSA